MASETVVDVREVPAFQRHPMIFEAWDKLDRGSVMILINDHDPKPLWYQFSVEYKDQFEWDYLEKGPDWTVKIKKV